MKILVLMLSLTIWMQSGEAGEENPGVEEAIQLVQRLECGHPDYGSAAPKMGLLSEWNLSVSAVNGSIDRKDLERLYEDTCIRIEKLWGRKLIGRQFNQGYPSRYALLELNENSARVKRLVVGLVRGNDSTSFTFSTRSDDFNYADHTLMTSWRLNAEPEAESGRRRD